jgi:prepilin-type N-terminal cleavage/methylation domain-containing protein
MKRVTKRAFTLIELLVVIVVIALLMTILLPALGRARLQAKKARVASQITGISVALHAFANDNGDFPNSDPFNGYPQSLFTPDPNCIPWCAPTGAHLLALALVGRPDGRFLSGNTLTDKGKTYIAADKANAVPDTFSHEGWVPFPSLTGTGGQYGGYGNYILRDVSFGSPILYYKANRRARYIITTPQYSYLCADLQPTTTNPPAAYYLSDNGMITGTPSAFGPFSGGLQGWGAASPNFRNGGIPYFASYIEVKGTRQLPANEPPDKRDPLTARAQNSEEFLLISAGPDRMFGPSGPGPDTCDDIANFTVPRTGPP